MRGESIRPAVSRRTGQAASGAAFSLLPDRRRGRDRRARARGTACTRRSPSSCPRRARPPARARTGARVLRSQLRDVLVGDRRPGCTRGHCCAVEPSLSLRVAQLCDRSPGPLTFSADDRAWSSRPARSPTTDRVRGVVLDRLSARRCGSAPRPACRVQRRRAAASPSTSFGRSFVSCCEGGDRARRVLPFGCSALRQVLVRRVVLGVLLDPLSAPSSLDGEPLVAAESLKMSQKPRPTRRSRRRGRRSRRRRRSTSSTKTHSRAGGACGKNIVSSACLTRRSRARRRSTRRAWRAAWRRSARAMSFAVLIEYESSVPPETG